ncbi:ABC transporter ATP-binding protein [Streptomyces sp. V2]|uniref:ABC transporter ATP-binding protein n=1 Tax=Streptomyces TaxID=1883 RepID=UPI000D66D80A|nr:ATP-binding cassette domain-containing protein [Streptomyces sp. V2]PWG11133.1 ABC transporter ATP-binding protein [Streptomyces sp. V2]
MPTAPPPAVEAEALSFTYDSGGGLVHADLVVEAGATVAVQGPSGSGKSTLLALLGLILSPGAGRLSIAGTDVGPLTPAQRDRMRQASIGIVLQDLGLLPFLTAWENVAAAFGPRLTPHRTQARALLAELGMETLADARVTGLSGGQRQRVAVARAAVKRPVLVLADEPTAGLDPKSAEAVVSSLRGCAERGAGVLVVTHDPLVAAACDRRYALEAGVLAAAHCEEKSS